jgi:hypothetical protein
LDSSAAFACGDCATAAINARAAVCVRSFHYRIPALFYLDLRSSFKAAALKESGPAGDARSPKRSQTKPQTLNKQSSCALLSDPSLQGVFGGGRRGRIWAESLYLLHCACSYCALER